MDKKIELSSTWDCTLATEHHMEKIFDTTERQRMRKGMNPKNLQYIMGHSEIAVTMDTYTHMGFEDARADFLRVVEA